MAEVNAELFVVGNSVWVPDEGEAWLLGEVKSKDGDKVVVKLPSGEKTIACTACHRKNPPTHGGVEDMTKLSYLHEPGVLNNLETRYTLDEIYTYTGSILIAVNPFHRLPHLYANHMMEQYKGVALGELSPHVFAVADAAYRAMSKEKQSQSILVSGESGAGKTETTKLIMQYLAYMGGRKDAKRSVEQQVLESNPLLEAFGNAKTVRNDNSSRFGKFVEIQFDGEGKISGAAIRTYLLERSRVVTIGNPERNYHIFYQLVAGASEEDRELFRLGTMDSFHYLNQSKCYDLNRVDNAEEYANTKRAMSVVGIEEETQHDIFRMVAAILHLGNISFKLGKDDAAIFADEKSNTAVSAVAFLLMVNEEDLKLALLTRTIVTREETFVKPLDVPSATNSRDSLAKTLYSKLFDWLVEKINSSIGQDPKSTTLVGVLDIYGFESFKTNSFEQFCINLANEKLQQHFNQHVFKMEQEEYTKEEIDWSYIDFVDNQDVLNLIEGKPMGILAVLDEQCRFPKSTPETLALKLCQEHAKPGKENARFVKPKRSQVQFTLKHYAGDVTYDTESFIEKNKDFVVAEHQNILQASGSEMVKTLFPPPEDGEEVKSAMKFASVGGRFKVQLGELMKALSFTEPHYVRCIKPNTVNTPGIFEKVNVLHQLRCGGVLEAVRISCAGYPSRKPIEEFVDRFGLLTPGWAEKNTSEREVVSDILSGKASLEGWQIGKSKVFLRAGQMAVLDNLRTKTLNQAATIVQKTVRRFLFQKQYQTQLKSARKIQSMVRGGLARKQCATMRKERAAKLCQKNYRMCLAQKKFSATRKATIRFQAATRGWKARNATRILRRIKAAVCIQKSFRRYSAAKSFRRSRRQIVMLQCLWRCKIAKRVFRAKKAEARETGALLGAKAALEKKVKDMEWRVELEKRLKEDAEKKHKEEMDKLTEQLEEARSECVQASSVLEEERTAHKEALEGVAEERAEAARLADEAAGSAKASEWERLLAEANEALEKAQGRAKELEEQAEVASKESSAAIEDARKQAEKYETRSKEKEAELKKVHTSYEKLQLDMRKLEAENQQLQQKLAAMPVASTEGIKEVMRARAASGVTEPASAPIAIPAPVANGAPPPSLSSLSKTSLPSVPGSPSAPTTPETPSSTATPEPSFTAAPVAKGRSGSGVSSDAMEALEREQAELDAKKQRILMEKQQGEQETMLKCLTDEIGFANERPVAACIIFRSLLHWRSFEAERTNIFDRIIQTMSRAIENHTEDNQNLAYWLANTTTLLFLLQKTLRTTAATNIYNQQRRRTSVSLFDRWRGGFSRTAVGAPAAGGAAAATGGNAAAAGGSSSSIKQVEAKYPALLFKQQLTAFVEKIYGMVRDNVKKEITPQLGQCIQAPRAARGGTPGRRDSRLGASGTMQLSQHWRSILGSLETLLRTLKSNYVPKFLIRKLFSQVFSFINVQLFNSLLLRRECCSFSNGEYVKTGLAELENWLHNAGQDSVDSSWEELKYIRQAVTFLVIHQKPKKTLDEITNDLCPVLSVQQLYRISTMYWDDKYGTETVSQEVLSNMKQLMMEDTNSAVSNSFLLDDDSSIPFSVDDITTALADVNVVAMLNDLPYPPSLRDNPSFQFLESPMA
ncbi:hypothetical protein CYMTET_3312 [Cymbomonas tetramitiformis]|uniref:Myosin XI n=1 Tax=Cymbomonas tetramitiformis TaxID=36881 RepID=A0AAE0H5D2_9CHLO|nr:hypothetical protein CYMTET_3312 [Cymbomonas tetramitiformis]